MKTPLRVAFVSVLPSPYQKDLFAALAERPEIDLRVFYMEDEAPDSPWPRQPFAPWEKRLPGFWFPFRHARIHCNWRLPSPRNFDVIVCNTLMSVTAQWMMRRVLRCSKWMFWGEKLGRRSRFHDVFSSPLHRATGIAAIGTRAERDYAERFPGVPIFNIPYHCNLDRFRAVPRISTNPGEVTFLFCGQMIARKGIDQLLRAFATLPTNTRLLLVGREAELPSMLAQLPEAARSRVEYAGFQTPDALPDFFARANAFVLPSRYDGWGVVVNQALGAGLPIIVSDQVGAAFDLVTPGKNGEIFPSGDEVNLASKMRFLAENPAACESWAAESRLLSFDWDPEDGAERWIRALQTITA